MGSRRNSVDRLLWWGASLNTPASSGPGRLPSLFKAVPDAAIGTTINALILPLAGAAERRENLLCAATPPG